MGGEALVETEERSTKDVLVAEHGVQPEIARESDLGGSLSDEDVSSFGLGEWSSTEVHDPRPHAQSQIREEPVDGARVEADVDASVGLVPIHVGVGRLQIGSVDDRDGEVLMVDLTADQEPQPCLLPEGDVALRHDVEAMTAGFVVDGRVDAADVAEKDPGVLLVELGLDLFDVLLDLFHFRVDCLNLGLGSRSRDNVPADVDPLGLATGAVPGDAHGGLPIAGDQPPGMARSRVGRAAGGRTGRGGRADGGAVQGDKRLLALLHGGQSLATPLADPAAIDGGASIRGMLDHQVAVGQSGARRRLVVEVLGRGRGADHQRHDEAEDECNAAKSLLVHAISPYSAPYRRLLTTVSVCYILRCRNAPVFAYNYKQK